MTNTITSKEQIAADWFAANPHSACVIYVCSCGHIAKYYERTNGASCPQCGSDELLRRSNRFERID